MTEINEIDRSEIEQIIRDLNKLYIDFRRDGKLAQSEFLVNAIEELQNAI